MLPGCHNPVRAVGFLHRRPQAFEKLRTTVDGSWRSNAGHAGDVEGDRPHVEKHAGDVDEGGKEENAMASQENREEKASESLQESTRGKKLGDDTALHAATLGTPIAEPRGRMSRGGRRRGRGEMCRRQSGVSAHRLEWEEEQGGRRSGMLHLGGRRGHGRSLGSFGDGGLGLAERGQAMADP